MQLILAWQREWWGFVWYHAVIKLTIINQSQIIRKKISLSQRVSFEEGAAGDKAWWKPSKYYVDSLHRMAWSWSTGRTGGEWLRSNVKPLCWMESEIGRWWEINRTLLGRYRSYRHNNLADGHDDRNLRLKECRRGRPTFFTFPRGASASRAQVGQRANLRTVRVHVQVPCILDEETFQKLIAASY